MDFKKVYKFKFDLIRALVATKCYSLDCARIIVDDLDSGFLADYAECNSIDSAMAYIFQVYTQMSMTDFEDLEIDFGLIGNDFWELGGNDYLIKCCVG